MKIKTRLNLWLLLLALIISLCSYSCVATGKTQEAPAETAEVANNPNEITTSGVGKHNGYTWEYWNQDNLGKAVMTLKEGSTFDCKWSGIHNMLGRIGIRPGLATTKVTYNVDSYSVNSGLSYLCVYGWTYNTGTRDNLVEFYIVDNWKNFRPPGGSPKGTVTVDGDEYDIYTSMRMQQPSIFGTRTFQQYWSVRKNGQQRLSGTIDVAAHFKAWEELDMKFGDTLYEVSFCIEGYETNNSGSGSASISELRFE
ncbi:MAG: glycoside hydrolase family 11 protein [Spirochaetales bacterium]|nr:glycoside hydrolase family 11 protein [Spirochaetales bacterium]